MASENIYENVISDAYNNYYPKNKNSEFKYLISNTQYHFYNKYEVALHSYNFPNGWDTLPFGCNVHWLDEILEEDGTTRFRLFGTDVVEPGNYNLEEMVEQVNEAVLKIYRNYIPECEKLPDDSFIPKLKIIDGYVMLRPGLVPSGKKSIIKVGMDLRGMLGTTISGTFYEVTNVEGTWIIDPEDLMKLRKPDIKTYLPYAAISLKSSLTGLPLSVIPIEDCDGKPRVLENLRWLPVNGYIKNPVKFWTSVDKNTKINNNNHNNKVSFRLIFRKLQTK